MGDGPETVEQLTGRAQDLLGAGQPAAGAEVLTQALEGLEASRSEDVRLRADLQRLLGSALRESGDLEGSTRSLQLAVDLLDGIDLEADGHFTLAAALRSLALNYDAAGDVAKAGTARARVLEALPPALPWFADPAAGLIFTMATEVEELGRSDWLAPVEWLNAQVSGLGNDPALTILRRLYEFWSFRGDEDAAAQSLNDALARVDGLDDEEIRLSFTAVHELAWAAIESDRLEAAADLNARMQSLLSSLDADRQYAALRFDGLVLQRIGRTDEALARFEEVHRLARDVFGESDTRTRVSLRDLADALGALGRREEAIDRYREVLDAELEAVDDPVRTADVAAGFARQLDAAMRYAEADEANRLAYSLRERFLGPLHPATNRSRFEIAELSRVLGRVDEAEFYFLECLDASAQLEPATDARALGAQIRNNLADLYVTLGRFEEARPLLEDALTTRRTLFGDESERAWRTRLSMATLEATGGDPRLAIGTARAAIERDELAANASWHIVLADGLLRNGEIESAEDRYRRIHDAISDEDVGKALQLQVYLDLVRDLVVCRVERRAWAAAAQLADEVLGTIQLQFPELVQESSEMQLARFMRSAIAVQSLLLTALIEGASGDDEALAATFDLVNLVKGLRTRYLRWRQPGGANVEHVAPAGHDQRVEDVRAEMRQLIDELTSEALSGAATTRPSGSRLALARRARLRELERELAGGIGYFEMVLDHVPASSAVLPDQAMILEVVVVRDIAAERLGRDARADRYVAFVLGPGDDGSLQLIELGNCPDIDAAVAEIRESLSGDEWLNDDAEPPWLEKLRYLGQEILPPISPRIGSAEHLLVAPDGALAALPFEILIGPGGDYLLDELDVSYLMRTGDVRGQQVLARKGGPPLVLAGPDFDLPDAITTGRESKLGFERLITADETVHFDELPGARREGEAVGELLGLEPLVGPWALARELVTARSPEIVHIATHGFCLPLDRALDDLVVLGTTLGNAVDQRAVLEDPLQRSGLAFSGANAGLEGRPLPPEAGTGFVYAADIQQLDLQQTDLVVLSACRAGLGDLEIGDGAHGMRRAFLAAGCRSVVSSLWDLPDVSASVLVERFYEALLGGAGRLEALSAARAAVRERYPNDPLHWAGLVLDGAFDPLFRFSPVADVSVASLSLRSWGIESVEDTDAMQALAARLAEGPSVAPPEADEPYTATALRRVLLRTDLDDELRVHALYEHADLATRIGDHQRAIADFRAILASEGLSGRQRSTFSYDLAKTLQMIGDLEGAVAGYATALDGDASSTVRTYARVNRAAALKELGRPGEAIEDATAVINDPEAPADQVYMALVNRADALGGNDVAAAVADVDAAVALGVAQGVESARLKLFRAHLLVHLDRDRALEEIAELEADPQVPPSWQPRIAELRSVAQA